MEDFIYILILIHAITGGVALVSGTVAGFTKKGAKWHIKSGLLFYYSMLISTLNGLLVATLPGHYNPFLLGIGIFSIYLLLSGKRSLLFKKAKHNYLIDKLLSSVMICAGFLMIFLPLIVSQNLNIILLVFGLVGIGFSTNDLLMFKEPSRAKKKWLTQHIVKISGAYISAISAFLVVNNIFYPMVNWFGPGVLGTIFIIFYINKAKLNRILTK